MNSSSSTAMKLTLDPVVLLSFLSSSFSLEALPLLVLAICESSRGSVEEREGGDTRGSTRASRFFSLLVAG